MIGIIWNEFYWYSMKSFIDGCKMLMDKLQKITTLGTRVKGPSLWQYLETMFENGAKRN
jgi:hypothetical protein